MKSRYSLQGAFQGTTLIRGGRRAIPDYSGIKKDQGLAGGLPEGGVPDGGVPEGGVPEGAVLLSFPMPSGGVPAGGVPEGAVPLVMSIPFGGVPDGCVPSVGTAAFCVVAGVCAAGDTELLSDEAAVLSCVQPAKRIPAIRIAETASVRIILFFMYSNLLEFIRAALRFSCFARGSCGPLW